MYNVRRASAQDPFEVMFAAVMRVIDNLFQLPGTILICASCYHIGKGAHMWRNRDMWHEKTVDAGLT